ncbi:FKBP-type peptidyl-prolyl cis-trans isomerase [Candidatus Saccharibacteria bacterium]|nr:FKBP-type peptidyl-prolyl cis-trans isomerase [Candidatus Saccharibacteria bacterium]
MQENLTKTSLKQRLISIAVIAVLLVTSVGVYIAVILGNKTEDNSVSALEAKYMAKEAEIAEKLSPYYYDAFYPYLANVTGYNAEAANAAPLETKDLKEGDGFEITNDASYFAYYIGYCPDESIFESSFNADKSALNAPIKVENSTDMIKGWADGILGMKIGGVREIDIPSEQAYGDTREICGSYNSPLRFIVMPVSIPDDVAPLYTELDELYTKLLTAYYAEYYKAQSQTQTVETVE